MNQTLITLKTEGRLAVVRLNRPTSRNALSRALMRELMFTGERVDAERCERIGLINRVVPDAQLMESALTLAKSLADGPRLALAAMKDNLDDAMHVDFATACDREAERMIRISLSADHREAVRAFTEKRSPTFIGA